MMFQLQRKQQLNCDINTAWKFFSSPNNLADITPGDMDFIVKDELDQEIFVGMEINYTVSPIMRIPLKWKTIITEVDYEKSFVDFQAKGPFKLWNHKHEFFPNEQGVLMIDTVDYQLPFGVLGKIAHQLLVKKKLENIFNYRYDVMEDLFNKKTI